LCEAPSGPSRQIGLIPFSASIELRQIIRTEEPPRPSARISTLAANLATTVAGHRRSDPRKLFQIVRGDLDWIVMKCLEKDRTRRYETANGLAQDIERYMHDEPVEACPPSTTYRLRKFARRNKTVLTTITLVAVSLMIGTGVSIWQAAEAVASKEEAVASKEIAEQQRSRAQVSLGKALEAVDKMLTRVGDETLKNVPLMDKVRREVLRMLWNSARRCSKKTTKTPPCATRSATPTGGWVMFIKCWEIRPQPQMLSNRQSPSSIRWRPTFHSSPHTKATCP